MAGGKNPFVVAALLGQQSALSRDLSGRVPLLPLSPAQLGTWKPATLLPFEENSVSGQRRPALPNALRSIAEALLTPGNALQGNYPPRITDGRVDPYSALIPPAMNMAGSVTLGAGAMPRVPNALNMGVRLPKRPEPRTFYRGTNPGDTRRIATGHKQWDGHLFAADSPDSAKMYGSSIEVIEALPSAKILYEGSPEFRKVAGTWRKGENMLAYSSRAAEAAKDAGYDAVWFERQSDIGTAIINPSKFKRGGS